MVVFAKVKLWVVAVPVAVLELVAFVVERVGDAAVRAASPCLVYLQDHAASHPATARSIRRPFHDGPFPIGFMSDVLFEVDAVVDSLQGGTISKFHFKRGQVQAAGVLQNKSPTECYLHLNLPSPYHRIYGS